MRMTFEGVAEHIISFPFVPVCIFVNVADRWYGGIFTIQSDFNAEKFIQRKREQVIYDSEISGGKTIFFGPVSFIYTAEVV